MKRKRTDETLADAGLLDVDQGGADNSSGGLFDAPNDGGREGGGDDDGGLFSGATSNSASNVSSGGLFDDEPLGKSESDGGLFSDATSKSAGNVGSGGLFDDEPSDHSESARSDGGLFSDAAPHSDGGLFSGVAPTKDQSVDSGGLFSSLPPKAATTSSDPNATAKDNAPKANSERTRKPVEENDESFPQEHASNAQDPHDVDMSDDDDVEDVPLHHGDDDDDDDDAASIAEREGNALSHTLSMLSPLQAERFENYMRCGLQPENVKRVVSSVTKKHVKTKAILLLSSMTKLFMGQLVEEGRSIMDEWGDTGSLRPEHLREAYRREKEGGRIPYHKPTSRARVLMM